MGDKYEFYPEITDKDFMEKIFLKKEFHDNRSITEKRSVKDICTPRKFELQPHQRFVKNYVSSTTPYNGLLIYHEVGTGKTCSSIAISEGFKRDNYFNKRTTILTDIQDQFSNEIFNPDFIRKGIKTIENQCTGTRYALDPNDNTKYLNINQKINLIKKRIKNNYEIIGPIAFANKVKREVSTKKAPWNGSEKALTDEMKDRIRKKYSNQVFIIDEIQNVKSKSGGDSKKIEDMKVVPPVLRAIVKYADNIRLVLMSATPMFDNPTEIVFVLNLLLLNDKREPLKESEIFKNKDGDFVKGGKEKLREAMSGYVSYYSGKNPIAYPVRIEPKDAVLLNKMKKDSVGNIIKPADKMKFTKLIPCQMSAFQAKWSRFYSEKNRIAKRATTNIVFPSTKGKKGIYPKDHATYVFNESASSGVGPLVLKQNSRRFFYTQYKLKEPFFDAKYLPKYSAKMSAVLDNILKAKGGISLIYSLFIWWGVIPVCLMLEQNGFIRYTKGTSEPALLDAPKPPPICYYCSKPKTAKIHNKGSKGYHEFHIAYYIVATGNSSINHKNAVEIAREVSKIENADGKMIKVVVGNQVISEGIDFKRLRQIHILEPWYNLSKIRQIIGRGDRFCSHADLPEKERNVEVFKYASVFPAPNKDQETYDVQIYRKAEKKDIRIKDIERMMKEKSVDCPLNLQANNIESKEKIAQTTTSGNNLTVSLEKKPFTEECDYKEDCRYKCEWEPKKGKDYTINTDTYRIQFSETEIENTQRVIRNLYRKDVVFNLHNIQKEVEKEAGKKVDKLIIYNALDRMIKDRKAVVFDRFNREGKLIYRGNTYVYQPNELKDPKLPVMYRRKMLSIKPEEVELYKEVVDLPDAVVEDVDNSDDNRQKVDVYQDVVKTLNKYFKDVEPLTKEFEIPNIQKHLIDMSLIRLHPDRAVILLGELLTKKAPNNIDQMIIEHYKNQDIFFDDGKAFVIDNVFYCLDSEKGRFEVCSDEDKFKYRKSMDTKKTKKKKKEKMSDIYGVMTTVKGKHIFKIVDTKKAKGIKTKSGRESIKAQITGMNCTSYQKGDLIGIIDRLTDGKMKKKMDKLKKNNYCVFIEALLNHLQETGAKGKTWLKENQ